MQEFSSRTRCGCILFYLTLCCCALGLVRRAGRCALCARDQIEFHHLQRQFQFWQSLAILAFLAILIFSVRMPATRIRRPSITLIGAGNLAQALGPALKAAGYRIDFVAARQTASSRRRAAMLARMLGARTQPLNDAGPDSDILWICHTDDALAETARRLARKPRWQGKIVFHSSGALSSDVLSPLKRKGAN